MSETLVENCKRALICGISGQDGSYLARLLLNKGYQVYGSSRDAQLSGFTNLKKLGIAEHIHFESMAINDFRSVLQLISKVRPDEIYNLAGQSSVGLSFEQPMETMESIQLGTLNILEVIRFLDYPLKFYNAASSECFGETGPEGADENTPFHPRSPYAVAKAAAFWEVNNYREAYNLYACSGILFNHESPLRPERFVTQKIIAAACRIAQNKTGTVSLGNLHIQRDWGWAPEYVEAMWLMLQQEEAEDFVIASGTSWSLEDFLDKAFSSLGMDWHEHVQENTAIVMRPSDLQFSQGNPAKAYAKLGWQAKYSMPQVVSKMIDATLQNNAK